MARDIMATDGQAVTFGTARRELGGLQPSPVPSSSGSENFALFKSQVIAKNGDNIFRRHRITQCNQQN